MLATLLPFATGPWTRPSVPPVLGDGEGAGPHHPPAGALAAFASGSCCYQHHRLGEQWVRGAGGGQARLLCSQPCALAGRPVPRTRTREPRRRGAARGGGPWQQD